MGLELNHIELKDANDFISRNHRHHKPVVGHRFSLGAIRQGSLVGVAIVGRPVARRTDHTVVAEVTKLCTDGTKNACSFLYSAAARAAKSLGYAMIQTFILDSEPGTSLLATGWERGHTTKTEEWNRPSRGERRTDQPNCAKVKWFRAFKPIVVGDCHCEHGIDIREAMCSKCGIGELDYQPTCFMCAGARTIGIGDGESLTVVPCPECSQSNPGGKA